MGSIPITRANLEYRMRKDKIKITRGHNSGVAFLGDAPETLDHYGKELWDELASVLNESSTLTEGDIPFVKHVCHLYSELQNSREDIAKHGTLFEVNSKQGTILRESPAVKHAQAWSAAYKLGLKELGLTPRSRHEARGLDAAPAVDNPARDFITK